MKRATLRTAPEETHGASHMLMRSFARKLQQPAPP